MNLAGFLLLSVLTANTGTAPESLVDAYFDEYFSFAPSEGTSAGFHQYDSRLENYSDSAIRARLAMQRKYLAAFQSLPRSDDRDLMVSRIQAAILNLDSLRPWQRNPDFYSSSAASSIFGLISRKFAPAEQRLRSVIQREQQIPGLIAAGKANLRNPPRIYTEIALQQLPGIESFFKRDVPKAFDAIRDQQLLSEFVRTNATVIQALEAYQKFLQDDLLPRSQGDFRIGAEDYRKKLLYEEMVDIPLARLLKIGYENLHENQRQLALVAKQIDPAKTPQQIADELGNDHPQPGELLNTFQNTFASLKNFIDANHIIGIPSPVEPILEETPPFMRALTTASMDTPGPYETRATEAYFNVTLPEKKWSPTETQEFMTAFSRGTIVSTAIHEAYPGHYVQLLWFHRVNSKVRKLSQCGSNVEGWAHYTEQMMLDEGYGNHNPNLRFGQLLDALLRNCRYIVGIEMHTGTMSYEEGIRFFMKEAYMTRAYAERETKRGTSDPTYLVYTLGKLQILKLREDVRQNAGASFNMEKFHNDFVSQGGIPIKLIRKKMLGNDSPTL